jgi:hypothetical protein
LSEHFAQQTLELATVEGFSFWQAGARVLRGWAWPAQGAGEIALAEIRRGIDAWLATGGRTYQTYYLGLLASVFLRHRQPAEALDVLNAGLAAAQPLHEHFYEAELWQLKAHAIGKGPNGKEASSCLSRGLAIAEAQHAKYVHQGLSGANPCIDRRGVHPHSRRTVLALEVRLT